MVAVFLFNINILLMNNPWNDYTAFSVMYTDYVSFEGVRKNNTLHKCSSICAIFPVIDSAPFCDIDLESDVKIISIVLPLTAFAKYDDETKPQIGDTVTLQDNSKYKVSSIAMNGSIYDIRAKSI